jgi:hypothetical protein
MEEIPQLGCPPNKSFKLTGPLVTRLAVVEKPKQAARQPSLQLNSTVRLACGFFRMADHSYRLGVA